MKRYIAVLAGLVLSPLVSAQDAQVPPALLYSNKPIDSLCFSNQEGKKEEIRLDRCGAVAEKMTVKGQNADLLKKGYIGYDWQATKDAYPAQGYSYYRFFDAGNQQYWLQTVNNGGGSGDFTAVARVSRKNDNTMLMQTVMSGDRCNGGIRNVESNNGNVTVRVNMTAADFLSLANHNPHQFKAYDDLAACAVCCSAEAVYELDATLKPQLKYVDFSGHGLKPSEMPQQGTYQICFNNLVAERVGKGNFKLNVEQLKQFVTEFNEACVA